MKKKLGWLLFSLLLISAMLLASCGKSATTTTTPSTTVTSATTATTTTTTTTPSTTVTSTTPATTTTTQTAAKVPIYGGWLNQALGSDIGSGWDPVNGTDYGHLMPVTLALMRGDFWKGPAGTNEVSWRYPVQEKDIFMTKGLAKSWEIIDNKTIIFHLNEGIKWQNKPPVNGREVTAEDLKWGYERMMKIPQSGLPGYALLLGGITYTAVDKYTFRMDFGTPDLRMALTLMDWYRVAPREVIETYGNQENWRNVVGNGPFMLKDYVPGSSITYAKNPDYWETDPQGNRLPYINGISLSIMPDESTRYAALRTGKLDIYNFARWSNAADSLKSNPELQTTGNFPYSPVSLLIECDKAPFNNVNVRRALVMAIDRNAIIQGYHKGNSCNWVTVMGPPGNPLYWAVDELPASTKELFNYQPEKARQLLAEAGYPSGFATVIEVTSVGDATDYATMVINDWAKIGVTATIETHEVAIMSSLTYGLKLKAVSINPYTSSIGWGNWSWVWQPGTRWNFNRITDQHLTDLFLQVTQNYVDEETWIERWREIALYTVDQAYEIYLPGPNVQTLWQPWVNNYHGEYSLGRTDYRGFATYIWIDPSLKNK